jgi:hypothetical protein
MPVFPVLKRLMEEYCKFEVTQGYIVRHCLKKQNKTKI